MNNEDYKIVEGIVKGDTTIIKFFYKKNYQYIRKLILQNKGNEDDVEDIFQDALVLVYQKLSSGNLELRCSLNSYFYGVCKNMWRNRLRKKSRLKFSENINNDCNEMIDVVLKNIEYKEREDLYRKYFLKLNDVDQMILRLYIERKTMKEIAKLTGYTESYVRKKKFESKKKLLEMIEKDPIYKELKYNYEN
ncbi:RNA polymerase sigma factor (sigma-70 family) [Aquimarina sp. MAR_2010_214]|uniref:RNA polymerase sigma factor n=1 Tax=Aquimarina sp. MAR_2010_214 TaxID=1250026 RepID=UPI000CC921D5|nr:sigma-70 family RNA polymerase sigma factor [Aquimarina sp. MAR_2010_214]PKV48095.1 RNA polymerase sigma factor (sigma-70 family) [Aquimarina sp. MAR_2010_214]